MDLFPVGGESVPSDTEVSAFLVCLRLDREFQSQAHPVSVLIPLAHSGRLCGPMLFSEPVFSSVPQR